MNYAGEGADESCNEGEVWLEVVYVCIELFYAQLVEHSFRAALCHG